MRIDSTKPKEDSWLSPSVSDFEDGITLIRNVADDQETVAVKIQLWDDDMYPDPDKQMDIDDSNASADTVDINYDILAQDWTGDEDSSAVLGYSTADGYGDQLVDTQLDGKIKFTMYTDSELCPSKQDDLANIYSPILYFHQDENYYPRDIRDFLEESTLKDGSGAIVDSNPTEDDLAQYTGSSYYLDWNGNKNIDYGYKIYSHVFTATDNKIIIQYWFFYLNNPDTHEGDWEMIQIICNENESPQKAGYSQHYGGAKRDWGDVEKVDGTHPKVYVSENGHASYFKNGYTYGDKHDGSGDALNSSDYAIERVTSQNWLNFQGNWGESSTRSPPGPVFRSSKELLGVGAPIAYMWIEPIYWCSDFEHEIF